MTPRVGDGHAEARWFPVSLHATLLGALVCAALPQLHQVEDRLRAWMCLPLRAYAVWLADAGAADAPGSGSGPGSRAAADDGSAERLRSRQEAWASSLRGAAAVRGLQPLPCRVLERREPGSAHLPAVLVLDRSVGEVFGDADPGDAPLLVTQAEALLGFVERGDAAPDQPALVRLLHHRSNRQPPRRLIARADLPDAPGFRFVVEAASTIDRWPLRCSLLADPWLGSRLQHGGQPVHTAALQPLLTPAEASRGQGIAVEAAASREAAIADVPAGLLLGWMRIWGYAREDRVVPIGLFVEPAVDPAAVSTVVVWRSAPGSSPQPLPSRFAGGTLEPVRMLRLPGRAMQAERWFLSTRSGARVPRGAAVVRGGQLIGRVSDAGPGHALATGFAMPGSQWAFVLLPEAEHEPPVELLATIASANGRHLVLHKSGDPWRGADRIVDENGNGDDAVGGRALRSAGVLFTGGNGPHCPAGLRIGEAWPLPDGGGLYVVRDEPPPDEPAAIFVRAETP